MAYRAFGRLCNICWYWIRGLDTRQQSCTCGFLRGWRAKIWKLFEPRRCTPLYLRRTLPSCKEEYYEWSSTRPYSRGDELSLRRWHHAAKQVTVSRLQLHSWQLWTDFLRWRSVYLLVQKSHYKTGNVRKLEAAIKLYGSLVPVYPEALQKLTSMLLHPFPKIRNHVADVLFVAKGAGKGVNWMRAGKEDLRRLKEELDLGERP